MTAPNRPGPAEVVAGCRGALVAVVRSDSREEALAICDALATGGVRHLEITVNNEHGAAAIAAMRERADAKLTIGAGSVLDERAARTAVEAGAAFLVSPGYSERVHNVAENRGLAYIPGVLTPTEIMRARDAGLDFLKLFPAGSVGPAFLKDLSGPFPGLRIMPTGGVTIENMHEYFQNGAYCVGAGGSLVDGKLIKAERWNELTRRARAFADRLSEVNGA